MSTEKDLWPSNPELRYWLCGEGLQRHSWTYPAKGLYRCDYCLLVITKAEMKEHTDA